VAGLLVNRLKHIAVKQGTRGYITQRKNVRSRAYLVCFLALRVTTGQERESQHLLGSRFFARCSPIPLLPACGPIGLYLGAQRCFGLFKFPDEANPSRAFNSSNSGAILRFKSWVYDAK
jgi:hypothetical protein